MKVSSESLPHCESAVRRCKRNVIMLDTSGFGDEHYNEANRSEDLWPRKAPDYSALLHDLSNRFELAQVQCNTVNDISIVSRVVYAQNPNCMSLEETGS